MGDCCKRVGSFSNGIPKGIESNIAGLDVYISTSTQNQSDIAVLMISDIFGWRFVNNRVLADTYAEEAGVTVYLPDLFNEEHAPYEKEAMEKFNITGFLERHNPRLQNELVYRIASGIKTTHKKLIVGGYCMGAPAALGLGRQSSPADAVFIAHPSFLQEKDFEFLAKTCLVICAEHDIMFTPELKKVAHEITSKKANNGFERVYTTWHTFMGTTHGFCVRGDENDPFTARAMKDAQTLLCNYFKSI
ncbi:alpha/beta-hydrolase [Wallemia mellicola]|nr:alpha/beta-hydrolase [Wallemia mellicola]